MTTQLITTTGTGQWHVPDNVYTVTVTLVGGGSGGCSGWVGVSLAQSYGGAGGNAASAVVSVVSVTPNTNINYTVGTFGAGGALGGDNSYPLASGAGGDTTFTGADTGTGAAARQWYNYTTSPSGGTGASGPIGDTAQYPALKGGGISSYGNPGSYCGAGGGGGCTEDVGYLLAYAGGRGASGMILLAWSPVPVASFTHDPATGSEPVTIDFTDTSTDTPTSWAWTFGDGATSTLQNPSHEYTTSGTKTVTLRATNAGGQSAPYSHDIVVLATTPVASFTSSVTSGVAPLKVDFVDTSTHVPTSWAWNFDDGSSTKQSPSHTFKNGGTYHVTLTATNSAGSDVSDITTITVTATVSSAFVVRPKSIYQLSPFDNIIKLFDKSTFSGSAASSWDWSISYDMTTITSTLQNPEITLPVLATSTPVVWKVELEAKNSLNVSGGTATSDFAIIQRSELP